MAQLVDQWLVVVFVLWALYVLWKQLFKSQNCQKICLKPANVSAVVTLRLKKNKRCQTP